MVKLIITFHTMTKESDYLDSWPWKAKFANSQVSHLGDMLSACTWTGVCPYSCEHADRSWALPQYIHHGPGMAGWARSFPTEGSPLLGRSPCPPVPLTYHWSYNLKWHQGHGDNVRWLKHSVFQKRLRRKMKKIQNKTVDYLYFTCNDKNTTKVMFGQNWPCLSSFFFDLIMLVSTRNIYRDIQLICCWLSTESLCSKY